MNETVTFLASEALNIKSAKALFLKVVFKKKKYILLLYLLLSILFFTLVESPIFRILRLVIYFSTSYLVLVWITIYFGLIKNAVTNFNLFQDKFITLNITDEYIQSANECITANYKWGLVNKVVDTGDFLILMNNRLVLLNLPKTFLNEQHIDFIKGKVKH